MLTNQVVTYLDSVGGLDVEARTPWPGHLGHDEVLRPLDASVLLGASGASVTAATATTAAVPPGEDHHTESGTDAVPAVPRWDVDAWYRPVHLAAYDAGIVVREAAVLGLARDLGAFARGSGVHLPDTDESARHLLRMVFTTLFLHQLFHHRVEMLALRMQVVEQRPRYVAYYREAYAAAAGTDDQLEESLANAYVYRALARRAYCAGIPNDLRRATCELVKQSWAHDEPGYRLAASYVAPEAWDKALGELHARVNEASTRPQRRATWRRLGPDLTATSLDPAADVAVAAPRASAPALPGTDVEAPTMDAARLIDLLQRDGYAPGKRGRGSHVRLTAKGRAVAIVPSAGVLSPLATRRLLTLLDPARVVPATGD
jgi:hypothetical protein